jgi:Protein of unknown function (DUF2939)
LRDAGDGVWSSRSDGVKRQLFLVFGIAIALLGAGGAWYALSPSYAMAQLAKAARDGDEAELRSRVDFPQVRESLKADLSAELAARAAEGSGSELGRLGAAIGLTFGDTLVDGLVTPQSIGAIVRQGRLLRSRTEIADVGGASPPIEWTIERDGLSGFTAIPGGPDIADPPSLIFERDGLGWTLVEIDLPQNR